MILKRGFGKIKNNKGQSILEFALILPFVFFFIFFHIQLCISYVLAEYSNYVSFMTARSVLTNGQVGERYRGVKNKYVSGMLSNILQMSEPRLINYDPQTRRILGSDAKISEGPQWSNIAMKDNENRNMGVELQYSIPIFLPFLREFGESLRFTSRSVLGREPYHGSEQVNPWLVQDPDYGDSYGKDSACKSVYNDNGC